MGLTNDKISISKNDLQAKKISGGFIGSPSDLRDMFDMAVKNGVKTWYQERPMDELAQAVMGE